MKHFKIGALKIPFLQIFPAKNKFENQIHIETRQKKDYFWLFQAEYFWKWNVITSKN